MAIRTMALLDEHGCVLYVGRTHLLRYGYLAKFIVLSEEESDLRLLDLAMDGLGTTEAALVEFLCAWPPG
jgi:hypothetical protein